MPPKGTASLNLDQQEAALALLRGGLTQQATAGHFGVSKNVIAGIWARAGGGVPYPSLIPTTLFDRCAALHAKLDQVLAETRVPRLPATPSRPGSRSPR